MPSKPATGTPVQQPSEDSQIERVLQDWPAWPLAQQAELVQVYEQGLNHKTALLRAGDSECVLKLFSTPAPAAIEAQRIASTSGVSPAILYAHPQAHYCLMEKLPGATLHGRSPSTREIELLAQSLHRLHALPLQPDAFHKPVFKLEDWCEYYLKSADAQTRATHKALQTVLQGFADNSTPLVFSHNDLVAENCLVTAGQAWFIDWEYAQANNPWFDLAALAYYLRLTEQQADVLLDAYWQPGHPCKRDAVFPAAKTALVWLDILWHLHQFGQRYWPKLQGKLADLAALAAQQGVPLSLKSEK